MGAFPVISWYVHVWLVADAPVIFLQNNGPRPFILIILGGYWFNVAIFLHSASNALSMINIYPVPVLP